MTVQEILRVWQTRQDGFKSWDVTYKGTEYQSAEYLAATQKDPVVGANKNGVAQSFECRVVAKQGHEFKVESDDWQWDSASKAFMPRGYRMAYNGSKLKVHFNNHRENTIVVTEEKNCRNVVQGMEIMPLAVFFQPLGNGIGLFGSDEWELLSKNALVGDKQCILIRQSNYWVWVENTSDALPIKLGIYRNGNQNAIRTIEYRFRPDPKNGPIPSGWTLTAASGNSGSAYSYISTVSRCEINLDIAKDVFDLEGTVNTWVEDYTTKQRYIVKPGNQKRFIEAHEYTGHNAADVVARELDPWYRIYGWYLWAALCVIIVLGAFCVRLYVQKYRSS